MKLMQKRWIAALAALLLALLDTGALIPRHALADDNGVRFVRVLLSTEGASTLTIPVTGTYLLTEANRTFTDGKLTVSASGSGVTVRHSAEGELYSGAKATVERANLARSAGSMRIRVVSGTRAFLGNFSFTSVNGAVQVVNRVPVSHYLYGVVGYEMSNDFPLEALKAQAVAAKGYVLRHLSSRGSYDIGDTANDQVYKGYVSTDTNVINAVDSTINDVLYYNGEVMLCYYAASNGGWMILPGTRWSDASEDGAYRSGPDPYDMQNASTPRETVFIPKNYSEREMGATAYAFIDTRLSAKLSEPGFFPENFRYGGISSVDSVVSTGDAGSPADKNHTGVTLTATALANLDPALIPTPTPYISPTPSPTPEITPTPSPTPEFQLPTPTPEPVPPLEGAPDYDPNWTMPTPTPVMEIPTPTPEWGPLPTPTPAWDPIPTPTPMPELTKMLPVSISFTFADVVSAKLFTSTKLGIQYAEPTEGGFNLLHARYGHGVGMSQRGAQQMAAMGKTYREILNFYYPGALLGTMGFASPEGVGVTVSAAAPNAPQSAAGTAATRASSGLVVRGTVNLRQTPSTKAKSLEKLAEGTPLTLNGIDGKWYYVTAPSGLKGFIRYDYVLMTGSDMIATGVVTASAVNYRTGPDTAFSSIGSLSRDTQLGVYGMEGGWYKVMAMTTGETGFIKDDYVKLTNTLAQDQNAAPLATPAPTFTPVPLPPGATPTPILIGGESASAQQPAGTPTPQPTATPDPIYAASGFINANRVNIRQGASTNTESYGRLNKNTPLGLYEKAGSWYHVCVLSNGQQGYVYAKYVSLNGTLLPDAQVSAAPATPQPAQSTQQAGSSQVASSSKGYINAGGVRIRTGAGTGYDSLGSLSRNTTVNILGSSGSWLYVEVRANDLQGYVFSKYVTMTGTRKEQTQTGVITSRLNLRTSPSTGAGSHVLLVMPRGAIVTVLSNVNGWCNVTYNGTTGYCISSCVRTG